MRRGFLLTDIWQLVGLAVMTGGGARAPIYPAGVPRAERIDRSQ